jgi:hypothetical protein
MKEVRGTRIYWRLWEQRPRNPKILFGKPRSGRIERLSSLVSEHELISCPSWYLWMTRERKSWPSLEGGSRMGLTPGVGKGNPH